MRTFGLLATAAIAVTIFATDVQAQAPQPRALNGPAYEHAVCACRLKAQYGMAQWPACMKRRGYVVDAGWGDWAACGGKTKRAS